MAEFWDSTAIKAAIAVAGFVGGIATKPLQNWIDDIRGRRRLRKILYVEMATLMSRCMINLECMRHDPSTGDHWETYVRTLWPCPCYEHAKGRPELFNELKDVRGINNFYGGLRAFAEGYGRTVSANLPTRYMDSTFLHLLHAFKMKVDSGELDAALLRKHGDERTHQLMAGIPDLRELITFFDNRNKKLDAATSQKA